MIDDNPNQQPADTHARPSPLRLVHDRKPSTSLIAGRNPVMEALRAETIIEKVVVLAGIKGNAIEKIKGLAKRRRVPFVEVSKGKFRELVSDTTTQGVVAVVGTKEYVEVEDILAVASGKGEPASILVLDQNQGPPNPGAPVRTPPRAGLPGGP